MKLEFGLDNVSVTEFGVGRDDGNGQTFVAVLWMRTSRRHCARWCRRHGTRCRRTTKNPSELRAGGEARKHGVPHLPLNDDLAAPIRALHESAQLDIDAAAAIRTSRRLLLLRSFDRYERPTARQLCVARPSSKEF